jgi:DNA replication licensing factor MCM6
MGIAWWSFPWQVRPELLFGSFECNECSHKIENVEQQFRFTQPTLCLNPICGNRYVCDALIKVSLA